MLVEICDGGVVRAVPVRLQFLDDTHVTFSRGEKLSTRVSEFLPSWLVRVLDLSCFLLRLFEAPLALPYIISVPRTDRIGRAPPLKLIVCSAPVNSI